MTAVRPTLPDHRAVAAFERTSEALGRTVAAAGSRSPLATEMRSSAVLLLAVLGVPLLLFLVLAP